MTGSDDALTGGDDELIDTINDRAERWFAERPAPGFAWSVFRAGTIIGSGMRGTATADGAPPTEHTAFRIASITKSFVSATTLALRDRGQLSLDTPITEILDWIDLRLPPHAAAPTLRMLMSMSGGLTTDDPWADRLEAMPRDEFRAMVNRGIRFGSVPGTSYAYSNLGYALLGRALETVTGTNLPELVGQTLLTPLGLHRTGFDAGVGEPLATGFAWANGGWQPLACTGPGAFSAIGGLFSTTTDLSRWAGWLSAAWTPDAEPTDSPLTPASRRELAQVARPIPPLPSDPGGLDGPPRGYGFGLAIDTERSGPVVHHSGGYPGWSAHLRFHPESGLGIVTLANATHSLASRFGAEAMRDLLPAPTAVTPWAETDEAVRRINEAARNGELSTLSGDWVSENLFLDSSLDQRRRDLRAALEILDGIPDADPVRLSSDDPSRRSWDLPAGRGVLRCRISLNPLGQLQSLTWSPVLRTQL